MSNTIFYRVGAEALQNALRACQDAESAYEQLLEKASNSNMISFIKNRIDTFSEFSQEISNELIAMNLSPQEKGTVNGGISRLWFDLKSAVLEYNLEMLLEETKRIDKDYHYSYLEIIRFGSYSEKSYEMLMNQISEINSSKRPQQVSNHHVIQSVQVRA